MSGNAGRGAMDWGDWVPFVFLGTMFVALGIVAIALALMVMRRSSL